MVILSCKIFLPFISGRFCRHILFSNVVGNHLGIFVVLDRNRTSLIFFEFDNFTDLVLIDKESIKFNFATQDNLTHFIT